ncbi:MAG: replication-associated recombination protein A [Erysipelotrichaceae bacterium]
MPLADILRPSKLEDVAGQRHILGPGKVLSKIIESDMLPNMIFYGPSGTGKTTVAKIIAKHSDKQFFRLNATTTSLSDIKNVIAESETLLCSNGVILFLDEMQYMNKKQQQSLLEYIENGQVTLIASTTENPFFYIYNAILSRSSVFEFKQITSEDMLPIVDKAIAYLMKQESIQIEIEEEARYHIAKACGGDARKAINAIELCVVASDLIDQKKQITLELAKQFTQQSSMKYDRDGDEHYDLMSALQKSIRGSDADAALYYLARFMCANDIISPIRRLLVIASEDVGCAYPQAIAIVKACCDSALQLGLPEARIPLAQAVVVLATAPKSNASYMGINKAMEDVMQGKGRGFPRCLQNKHADGIGNAQMEQNYLYPHDYKNHYVKQQYLPDDLNGTRYYEYGENKVEQAAKGYWSGIKGK